MRKEIALGSVLALGLGGQAIAAEGFSYSNIQASFAKIDLDGLSVKGNAFGLTQSYGFTDHIYGFAGYDDASFKDEGDRLSMKAWTLGVGYHWALSPTVDLVTGVSFVDNKLTVDGGEGLALGAHGFGGTVGVRGRIGEKLELSGGVDYVDLGGGADSTTFSIGGDYYFVPAFAAGLHLSHNSDGDTFGVTLRYDFGR